MKRTKQPRGDRRPEATHRLTEVDLAQVIGGDVYMHFPRGSNNTGPSGGG